MSSKLEKIENYILKEMKAVEGNNGAKKVRSSTFAELLYYYIQNDSTPIPLSFENRETGKRITFYAPKDMSTDWVLDEVLDMHNSSL